MESIALLWMILAGVTIAIVLSAIALVRAGGGRESAQAIGDELRAGRDESRSASKDLRDEVARGFTATGEGLSRVLDPAMKTMHLALDSLSHRMDGLSQSNQDSLERVRKAVTDGIQGLQDSNDKRLGEIREAVVERLRSMQDSTDKQLSETKTTVDTRVRDLQDTTEKRLGEVRTTLAGELKDLREGNLKSLTEMRGEVADGLRQTTQSVKDVLAEISTAQKSQLEAMANAQRTQLEGMNNQLKEQTAANQQAIGEVRKTLDDRVQALQESNEKKIDEMRKTVDEKLHDSLERRLGESFKLVSDRLEAVHNGLGEMRTLATGVGDLKKVLTNVKQRGGWAEMQLEALLEQTLAPEQYSKNVCVKPGSAERVEFAIKLPGRRDDPSEPMWVPIDSKFPQEDYIRLQEAAERGDSEAVQAAADALIRAIKIAAKDIHDKYINPPNTTDFAVMFLATEGLFSEVLRRPSVVEELLTRYRVTLVGPANLNAYLSSLRMGFQSVAIEKRASEVWKVLGAVKGEFGKFGQVLNKVQRQLNTASNTIDEAGRRTRVMEKRLRTVEALPEGEATALLALPGAASLANDADDADDADESDLLSSRSEADVAEPADVEVVG